MSFKIKIILTNEKGEDFLGETTLSPVVFKKYKKSGKDRREMPKEKSKYIPLDFSINSRAFMKNLKVQYISGPVKFVACVAYLSKGKTDSPVEYNEVKSFWNKTKSFLGKFNPYYSSVAKENAWVDQKTYGSYLLRNEGLEILKK